MDYDLSRFNDELLAAAFAEFYSRRPSQAVQAMITALGGGVDAIRKVTDIAFAMPEEPAPAGEEGNAPPAA